MDIHELLNKKVQLAEATSLPPECAPSRVHFDRASVPVSQSTPPVIEDDDSARSNPYTLMDDLSIFRVVTWYYGLNFRGKIPWSFWQTYKRATGSTRSNSSLYHHWNGAMKKKYESFISTGRLSDCILWLETAVRAEQARMAPPPPVVPHAGLPLCHSMSGPQIPIVGPGVAQRPLMRTSSYFEKRDFHLQH